MAKITVAFGVVLVAISLGFWLMMGRVDMAAPHPAGVGLVLILCGVLANTENAKQRMLWMHIAVTMGLIGFLITGIRAVVQMVRGAIAVPLAFDERVVVAIVCLVYVVLCVRSFIAARRSRLA